MIIRKLKDINRTGLSLKLQRSFSIILIIVVTLAITYLHYSTAAAGHTLHNIYRELYYIPVLLGALAYGLKGAALSYLLVFALYLPYIIINWTGTPLYEVNRFLQLIMQGLFAVIAGYLVDRERRQREQAEKERYFAGIGRTATAIVHDLKSPLIAILGFADRIKEGKGKIEAEAQTIINSAEKMQKIIYSVLDFAKPIQLELKEEDVREVITRASDSCRTRTEQAGVILSVELPIGPVTITVDSIHMERALVNLIINAVEASDKGRHVSISAMRKKGSMVITIKDHGTGMDGETLKNVFTPFYTRKAGGTGLGMSIAKKVIEGHHGKIRIDSKSGQGTEATIELPC